MWQNGNYGLYVSSVDHIVYWPDETGWYCKNLKCDIWLMSGGGWDTYGYEYKGAALVAPLPILFWEKE